MKDIIRLDASWVPSCRRRPRALRMRRTAGEEAYEYEEELYLGLDGSATLNVNASVPALVALRGVDLNQSARAIRS